MSSNEVDSAVGERPARVDVIELLNEKRAAKDAAKARKKVAREMRDEQGLSDESRLIDSLNEIIAELETEVVIVLEATGRKEAEERLLGIKRAAGSVRAELAEDNKRIRELETALREANAKRTARARKYETLQAEANSLADRYALPALKLEVLAEPPAIEVPAPWRHHMVRPSFEETKDGTRRTRRDYLEISGCPGYDTIMRTGLKPFRVLTEREAAAVTDLKAERKPDPVLAQAAMEANALGNLGMPEGRIARG